MQRHHQVLGIATVKQTSGPLIENRSAAKGSNVRATSSRTGARSHTSPVSASCAWASACRRPVKTSRSCFETLRNV